MEREREVGVFSLLIGNRLGGSIFLLKATVTERQLHLDFSSAFSNHPLGKVSFCCYHAEALSSFLVLLSPDHSAVNSHFIKLS